MAARSGSVLLAFPTALGWVGILHLRHRIGRVGFGYSSRNDLQEAFGGQAVHVGERDLAEEQWVGIFEKFSQGQEVSFASLDLDFSWATDFQRRVLLACREIPFGETLSYGRLAAKAGFPRAARAVGSVMRGNRHPLAVPCHRVVGRNGLGGFTSPRGIDMKRRLIELENGCR